jgi:acyl-CoA thioesterase FadM
MTPVATMNLNVTYKKPLRVGNEYLIKCSVVRHEDKKFFIVAEIVDSESRVLVYADSIMKGVNWDASKYKQLIS